MCCTSLLLLLLLLLASHCQYNVLYKSTATAASQSLHASIYACCLMTNATFRNIGIQGKQVHPDKVECWTFSLMLPCFVMVHNATIYSNFSVSEMTYTVSSGTLNSTISYHTVTSVDSDVEICCPNFSHLARGQGSTVTCELTRGTDLNITLKTAGRNGKQK